jgi:hypothetical protein
MPVAGMLQWLFGLAVTDPQFGRMNSNLTPSPTFSDGIRLEIEGKKRGSALKILAF